MGVVAISTSSFNALGKPAPPLIISTLQMLFLSIPFALVGDWLFGYRGIFIGSVLAVLVSACVCFIWLRRTIRAGQATGLRAID
jgi:Na+-driven multidrug efflux pump